MQLFGPRVALTVVRDLLHFSAGESFLSLECRKHALSYGTFFINETMISETR
jgi:hypothetical protein